jgi:hypothetical protein
VSWRITSTVGQPTIAVWLQTFSASCDEEKLEIQGIRFFDLEFLSQSSFN